MQRRLFKRGFTLVELMISIALVVILMLGITKVFSLTSQTAGATNQMSASIRDARAVQAGMSEDFSHAVTDGAPFMIIRSITQPAFRNKADRDADRDFDPTASVVAQQHAMETIDLDGNNSEGESAVPGEIIPISTYNYRNHRLDTVSFFTRHRFERMTGGSGTAGPLVSPMNSNEAWVWYGHLWLPDNTNSFPAPTAAQPTFPNGTPSVTFPGQWDPTQGEPLKSNPNNYYATQWIMGRVAMLLQEPKALTSAPNSNRGILDLSAPNALQQQFYCRDVAKGILFPLQAGAIDNSAVDSSGTPKGTTTNVPLEESRYDLAGTSIDGFRNILYNYITDPATTGKDWWSGLMCDDVYNTAAGKLTGGRFQASPFYTALNAATVAQQMPILARGCTQFIVEYAGDFLKQDTDPTSLTYGQVLNAYWGIDTSTTPETDGQIDFAVVRDPISGIPSRQIRWYGLPRDTNGDGRIFSIGHTFVTGPTTPRSAPDASELPDVLPLSDVVESAINTTSPNISATLKSAIQAAISANTPTSAPFERHLLSQTKIDDYAAPSNPNNFTPGGFFYTCAWNPLDRKPKMIRIIMTFDDPNGKLAEGQTFVYVFNLP